MLCIIHKVVKLKSLTTCRNRFNQSCSSLNDKTDIFGLIINMPHNNVSWREKDRNSETMNYSSKEIHNVAVEVIGSGAEGSPASIAIKTNLKNYLINCGEGTQKLLSEYKVKFAKSSDIFITFPSWENLSGLLGIALTLQESKVLNLNIHGHQCIGDIFPVVSKFASLRRLQVNTIKCTHYKEYTDGLISVKYVLLYPSSSDPAYPTLESSSTESSDSESAVEPIKKSKASHSSEEDENEADVFSSQNKKMGANVENDIKSENCDTKFDKPAVCYIFTTDSTSGALILEKCLDLGVPPGPLLGDLKHGKDVTLPDGKVVRSEDVKEPDVPGTKLIVVDCPSEQYLDSLLNEPLLNEPGEKVPEAVVHFSSSQVVNTLRYQNWIKHFPQETKHLFINEDNKLANSVAIHRQQFKLNLLAPDIFPLLHDSGIPDFPRRENCITDAGHSLVDKSERDVGIYCDRTFYKCETNNFIKGETMCQVYLRPKLTYDYSKCLVLKKESFLEEVYESDMKEKIEECKEALQELSRKLDLDNTIYPKIVFLGTGSSKPSKIRNSSGILIFTEEDKCVLFDCGENTYNQLLNFYGITRTREILRYLKAIFISHLHVDHHFGLITILKKRKLAFDELNETGAEKSARSKFQKVFLWAPVQIFRWLQLYNDTFGKISHLYKLIGNGLMLKPNENVQELVNASKGSLNLETVLAVPVCHCHHSYGISIIHENGWKITYSGDTRPCEDLVKLGMNSDILIHEATFDDIYKEHAKHKLHSTTNEALEVGRKMKANFILLTHFSQRYCYIPNIEEEYSLLNIGMAFDFMEVPFNKLPLLPELLIPLQYILSKYNEIVKSRTEATQRKRQVAEVCISPKEIETPAKISKKARIN